MKEIINMVDITLGAEATKSKKTDELSNLDRQIARMRELIAYQYKK